MFKKSIKFILFSSLLTSLPLQNHAGPIRWVKEKKQTYWDSLSTRKKIALGVAAGLTVSGLMYYALQRNDWQLWNYLKNLRVSKPSTTPTKALLTFNDYYYQLNNITEELKNIANRFETTYKKLEEMKATPEFNLQNIKIYTKNTLQQLAQEGTHLMIRYEEIANEIEQLKTPSPIEILDERLNFLAIYKKFLKEQSKLIRLERSLNKAIPLPSINTIINNQSFTKKVSKKLLYDLAEQQHEIQSVKPADQSTSILKKMRKDLVQTINNLVKKLKALKSSWKE